jgi:hypothetical protein
MEPTQYRKINRIIKNSPLPDLDGLLDKLRPVCFFDPLRPGQYRNRRILREILSPAIPNLEAPQNEPEY